MHKKANIIFFTLGLLILIGVYLVFRYSGDSYMNMNTVSTDVEISSGELISSFIIDEDAANLMYRGKIIEVEGIVKDITFLNNRNTIFLYGKNKYSSVICDMYPNQEGEIKDLKKGQKIKIKGVCKGFLKDAILLNCMLINTTINE